MDACQGSYKTKPYDLRFFSAYYLLLRFLILLISATTESVFYVSLTTVVVIAGGTIFAVFQPYKIDKHNKFDVILMFTLLLFYTAFASTLIASNLDRSWSRTAVMFMIISIVHTFFVLAFLVLPQKLMDILMKVPSVLCMKKGDSSLSEISNMEER